MNHVLLLALALVFLVPVAQADAPLFQGSHPALLAITVSDFENTGYGDSHATWYVYEANVEKVVAGEMFEDIVSFALLQTLQLKPVFPAQFVLVVDMGNSELEDTLGTNYHAISMRKAEETVCFMIDIADVFPDLALFDEIVSSPNSDSTGQTCYKAKALLDGLLE
jgi:hypothetical protein